MFITPHPGPWQLFLNRRDNIGKPILEIKQKYISEENNYFQQINALGGGPPQVSEKIILNEPFGLNGVNGSGFPYYNYPTNWTGDPNWIVYGDSDVTPFCNLLGSSGTMFLTFANGNSLLEVMNTKSISTINKTNIKINFNIYKGYSTGITPPLNLYYSPDNGSNWFTIPWIEPVVTLSWVNSGNIILPIGAENKSQLKIRFSITGDSSGENIAIDDFKVLATF